MSPLSSWWHLSKDFSEEELDLIMQLQVKVSLGSAQLSVNTLQCPTTSMRLWPSRNASHIAGRKTMATLGRSSHGWNYFSCSVPGTYHRCSCLGCCLGLFVCWVFFNTNVITKCKLELNVSRSGIINSLFYENLLSKLL